MKIKTIKSKAIYSLSALFAIVLTFMTLLNSSSFKASATTELKVLFDGTATDAAIPAADTNVDGIKVNIVGISEMQSISNGFTLDGVTYNKAIKTGGKSSTTRYFSFTVPKDINQFTVKLVAAPNGSEAAKFSLSTESVAPGSDDEIFFTTGASSSEYTAGISDVQTVTAETTYYLNFSASARIAYVAISPADKAIADQGSSSSSAQNSVSANNSSAANNSGLSSYSGTSSKKDDTNDGGSATNKRNTVAVVQMLLGVLLVVLIIVGIISIVKRKRKKDDYDYLDYEDFDDFDDFDE